MSGKDIDEVNGAARRSGVDSINGDREERGTRSPILRYLRVIEITSDGIVIDCSCKCPDREVSGRD